MAKVETILCAAPAYLEQRGAPRQPSELAQHEWIGLVPNSRLRAFLDYVVSEWRSPPWRLS